jgi:hypothetical protein
MVLYLRISVDERLGWVLGRRAVIVKSIAST